MEGFQINYTDIYDLFWEYKTNIENLMNKIDTCENCINFFIKNAVFTGKTGDAVKSYLTDVHITMLSSIRVTAQNLLDNMTLYKAGYYDIDNSTNFKLSEEAIRAFRTKLSTNYSDTESYTGKIQEAVSGISDISDVSTPGSNGVLELHEQLDQELLNLITEVQNHESSTVTALENSVDLLLSRLNTCIAKIGLNRAAIASYESNSFYTDKDVYALANISELFYQQHEDNKEVYDAICEAEQNLKDAAEERETQGVWKTVAGVGLLVVGGVCIVASWGAATPVVAAAEGIVGTGTTIFGVADSAEGAQDIYYGSIGDIDSTAVNDLKDVVFQGNEEAYYLTESVFAFAASAMIPIGQAASAGKLTFRSGATIVAKEGIATAAGAGAQKYTTDLTGNQAAGMIAGMAASMATAQGLNGIEAGVKKLAKPKLGDVGAVGGAVLNVADVGSAVKSGSKTATTIDYSYKFDRELANFNDGYEIRTTVDKDLILVQYSSDAPDASLCYWTTVDEANGITTLNDYMDKLALSKDWGNRNTVKVARIPAGTEVKYAVGTAREQLLIADPRPGGGVQYLFNQFDTDWITEIRSFSN